MLIGKVVGSAVSTAKCEALAATRLLLVREATPEGEVVGTPFVAVDGVGAGSGELVLVATGSAAREARGHAEQPSDALIVGILDSLNVEGVDVFRKD